MKQHPRQIVLKDFQRTYKSSNFIGSTSTFGPQNLEKCRVRESPTNIWVKEPLNKWRKTWLPMLWIRFLLMNFHLIIPSDPSLRFVGILRKTTVVGWFCLVGTLVASGTAVVGTLSSSSSTWSTRVRDRINGSGRMGSQISRGVVIRITFIYFRHKGRTAIWKRFFFPQELG